METAERIVGHGLNNNLVYSMACKFSTGSRGLGLDPGPTTTQLRVMLGKPQESAIF
jgi:hypothetical protein